MLGRIAEAARASLDAFAAERAASAAKARFEAMIAGAAISGAAQPQLSGAYGSYDNSRTQTRLKSKVTPAGGPAWLHTDAHSRKGLRQNAQDLERNSGIARCLIQRNADVLVADGGLIVSMTGDDGWNKEAERLWNEWAEGLNVEELGHPDIRWQQTFWQMIRGTCRAFMVDGDELHIDVAGPDGHGAVQVVESERLVNPGGALSTDRRDLIGGVRVSALGAPIEFNLAAWSESGTLEQKTVAVSARDAVLLINQSPVPQRPGQIRGEAALAAEVDRIDQIENYIEQVGVAAETATWIGLVFHSNTPAQQQASLTAATLNQPTRDSSDEPQEVEFGPGFAYSAPPGMTPTQVKPEFPTTNFRDYIVSQLMLICGSIGVPFPVAWLEFGGLTASNAKALLSLAWRCKAAEQEYLIRTAVSRQYTRKIAEWIRRGLLPFRKDWREHIVALQGPPVMDFKAEVDGLKAAVDGLFMTQDQAVRVLGTGRAEEIALRQGKFRSFAAQLGVLPPDLPGAKREGGQGQQAAAADANAGGEAQNP